MRRPTRSDFLAPDETAGNTCSMPEPLVSAPGDSFAAPPNIDGARQDNMRTSAAPRPPEAAPRLECVCIPSRSDVAHFIFHLVHVPHGLGDMDPSSGQPWFI